MSRYRKEIEDIIPSDFDISPVWEFDLANEIENETAVIPVFTLPVDTLANCFVGTRVRLANGTTMAAMLDCIQAADAYATRQVLGISLFKDKWHRLARYYDVDADRAGPSALAEALGLDVEEIFPITYDVRKVCAGDPLALSGAIEAEPVERLTDAQRTDLIWRSRK